MALLVQWSVGRAHRFTTSSGESYRPLRAGPLKLRNLAVEFAFLQNVLFLLGRHFRRVLTARHTARSKFPASDLVLRKSLVLPPIAILPPSMRSNTTETLSAFGKISRVSMGDPGIETSCYGVTLDRVAV